MEKENENSGIKFWQSQLNGAKFILAPMVEQSELAWRLLARRHGAHLCYTPMLHANLFVRDPTYRKDNLPHLPADRPLIVQFCGNNADILVEACELVAPFCDAVDLNLGCPQTIAKRGYYGAFLQFNWSLVRSIVSALHSKVSVPVTCKIRIFPEVQKTVEYARMLEDAGCQLLAVHGRTIEQRGTLTGLASWEHIRAVKEAVRIPVIANGNVQFFEDIQSCFKVTNVDGIMAAEGHLHNPCIFEGKNLPCWTLAAEYLEIVDEFPCSLSIVRGHLFKLFHHCLHIFPDIRDVLAKANSLSQMQCLVEELKERCQLRHLSYLRDPSRVENGALPMPFWLCQPYLRALCVKYLVLSVIISRPTNGQTTIAASPAANRKRQNLEGWALDEIESLSRKKLKKLARNANKKFPSGSVFCRYVQCACGNPIASRCEYQSCRACCKEACIRKTLNCKGHQFWFLNSFLRKQHEKEEQKCNAVIEPHFNQVLIVTNHSDSLGSTSVT